MNHFLANVCRTQFAVCCSIGCCCIYGERDHFFMLLEVYVTVTICVGMTSVSEVCNCIMR